MKKIYSIQVLRAICTIFVFLSHAYKFLEFGQEKLGGFAVSVFFVLAGYFGGKSISKFDTQSMSLVERLKLGVNIVIKKIKKVHPLYYFMMVMAIIYFVNILDLNSFNKIIEFKLISKTLACFSFAQSLIPNNDYSQALNWVSWFISTLYIITIFTPIINNLIKEKKSRRYYIVYLLILLLLRNVIETLIKVKCAENGDFVYYFLYQSPIIRSIDYIFGMIIYKMSYSEMCSTAKNVLSILGIMALISYYFIDFSLLPAYFGYNTIPAIFSIFIVIGFLQEQSVVMQLLSKSKLLVFIGDNSLNIYLIHRMVIAYTGAIMSKLGVVYPANEFSIIGLLTIVLTFIITLICSKLFDLFIEKVKNRKKFISVN